MLEPKAFICGHPIKHSRSPMVHGYWLKQYNIAGSYKKQDLSPVAFEEFIPLAQENGFVGGNVTIPHKEAAFRLVDKLDDVATKIGAVNTIWIEDNTLIGSNSDAYGFVANLDQNAAGWDNDAKNKTALIFGAGGASRAVLFSLVQRGISKIYLANRTIEKAENLAKEFGSSIMPITIGEVEEALKEVDIFVNSTSLGMNTQDTYPFDITKLKETALVTDLVYTPLETVLLKTAKEAGLTSVDGLGMLLHQAVPGFEKWFGIRPKVTAQLRQYIVDDLNKA